MLQKKFLVQCVASGLPLQAEWFMQDGTTPHTAIIMLDILNTVFGPRVISYHCLDCHNCYTFWPSLSPDLNSWNFILRCFFEGDVV